MVYDLGNRKDEDVVYIGLIILRAICRMSANVECNYDLSKKPSVLYNLRKKNLEELVGKAFLGVVPYLDSTRIPYDHILHLEYKVKLIIGEIPHCKSLEISKIEIENKLEKIYQAVGSEILRKLKEMNMIEIIETEKHENSPVYVKILDDAYKFIEKYEKYRITYSEYEYKYKIMEYD